MSRPPSAEQALRYLQAVQSELGAEPLAFLVNPNIVLTLAGARGYADSVEYYSKKSIFDDWQKILQRLESLGEFQGVQIGNISAEINPMGDPYLSADYYSRSGFLYTLEQTHLIPTHDLLKSAMTEQPKELISQLFGVVKATYNDKPPDILDIIVAGIFLGYPDKAINSALRFYGAESDSIEPIDAPIHYADFYICPQPVYHIEPALKDDPTIIAHSQLWSGILTGVYESEWFTTLQTDNKFITLRNQITSENTAAHE